MAGLIREAILLLLLVAMPRMPAHGQRISVQELGEADGLADGNLSCLRQDAAGFILACTDHGPIGFDGRRFLELGAAQGLPEGGVLRDIGFTAGHAVVLRYTASVFVSAGPLDRDHPPVTLRFRAVRFDSRPLFSVAPGSMAPWRNGMALVVDGELWFLDPGDAARPPGIRHLDGDAPPGPVEPALAVAGGALWGALRDGRLCELDGGARRCSGVAEGVPEARWMTLLGRPDGHLLARSVSLLVDLDTRTGRATATALPDQGGAYAVSPEVLALAAASDGTLATQAANGMLVRRDGRWAALGAANGLPAAMVTSALFDRGGELWLGVSGRGLVRSEGFDGWRSRIREDGLSSDVVWQMARRPPAEPGGVPPGPLWVGTDGGVDAVAATGVERRFNGASFAVAVAADGQVWRSAGRDGVERIAPNGATALLPCPPASRIVSGTAGRVWIGTREGLFVATDGSGAGPPGAAPPGAAPPRAVAGFGARIDDLRDDGADGLWILSRGVLWHRRADGAARAVGGNWPSGFSPGVVAPEPGGRRIWVGGTGAGLYRLALDDDRVVGTEAFGTPALLSNTVVALAVDRRGWLWAGTDRGVSAFDGRRWASADRTRGLVWNDVDENALFVDDDDSIWIGTSRGLSHLFDPETLFRRRVSSPVIADARLGGDTVLDGARREFSRDPLLIRFGLLDPGADGAVRFRYRLDGVDRDWVDTAAPFVRYPFLPPGRRVFELVAVDPLGGTVSPPVTLVLRMRPPAWERWPALAGAGLLLAAAALAAGWGVLRLRLRLLLRQRAALLREVEERTRDIREAQARDSLTTLLTRTAIQDRVALLMASSPPVAAGGGPAFLVAMADIDRFKRINDRLGHLAGDEILRGIGQRLQAALRTGEWAGRYGGEEILLVLSGDGARRERVAALLHAACAAPFAVDGERVAVTCSAGVAAFAADDDWRSLVGRADRALYEAKHAGRDRVVVASA
ncbi:MAG: diguanylate cyclase [Gluconacetobacter diazotrophicus]|nr:diguanylate cyclase [Gluconacetobacter diazotrophicus]